MNRTALEILRWQKQARFSKGRDRWTGWAHSLTERYMRTLSRYRASVMVLVQPRVPLYMLSQRWEHRAWGFYPKINLTIGPILQTINKHSKISEQKPVKQMSEVKPRAYNGLDISSAKLSYLSDARRKGQDRARVNSSIQEQAKAFGLSDGTLPSPLSRVFAKINRHSGLPLLSESLTQSNLILRRVVHERRRVEEGTNRTVVVQKQKNFVVKVEQNEAELLHNLRGSARLGTQITSQPQINVEQLTEQVIRQIDHRIRAYRERRGRAF